jgi:hypothetical protein
LAIKNETDVELPSTGGEVPSTSVQDTGDANLPVGKLFDNNKVLSFRTSF